MKSTHADSENEQRNAATPDNEPPTLAEMAERLGISPKALAGHFSRGEIPDSAYAWKQGRRVVLDAGAIERAVTSARSRTPAGYEDQEVRWRKQAIDAHMRVWSMIERVFLEAKLSDADKAVWVAIERELFRLDELLAAGHRGSPIL